ncbi:squamosa promoter-binding-like protein 8 [Tasmannia lanceolata]|uniref:squamosa promoter-binding-like protein 8 n=1 Tax=Tasmannia lanceolata TaxID=3420 RepID=UPI004064B406
MLGNFLTCVVKREKDMLDYQWGNPAGILLPGEEPTQDSDQTRQIFDPYNQTLAGNIILPEVSYSPQQLFHQNQNHSFQTLIDSHTNPLSSISPSPGSGMGFSPRQPFWMNGPETEQFPGGGGEFSASRIGLNLGGRTYFSSEDDFVSRLYRRSRGESGGPANSPRCQAEGCAADLTHAKHYHRRHKVCEFHSKASTVLAAGLTQRFCQQCSRFHLLSEFDHGKRSCRKRLADHNRRRRKSQPQQQQSQSENPQMSQATIETLSKSSPESGTRSSSVSIAISPPRITLDCLRLRNPPPILSSSSCSSSTFCLYDGRLWDEEQ